MQGVVKDVSSGSDMFATGYGPSTGQVYYTLADDIALRYLHKNARPEHDFETFSKHAIESITDFLIRFQKAAETLIAEVLEKMGWWVQPRSASTR